MAIHQNIKDLTIESVWECLDAAELLIDHRKADGGMMGYAAALLLLSVVDAIGHHLGAGSGYTRLEALNSPEFGLHLSSQQIKKLKSWYRNSLAHNASIIPGVLLSPEDTGDVFEFEDAKPVMIRVPQLYGSIRRAWDKLDRTNFNSLKDTLRGIAHAPPLPFTGMSDARSAPGMASAPESTSASTMPASGMVTPSPDGEV